MFHFIVDGNAWDLLYPPTEPLFECRMQGCLIGAWHRDTGRQSLWVSETVVVCTFFLLLESRAATSIQQWPDQCLHATTKDVRCHRDTCDPWSSQSSWCWVCTITWGLLYFQSCCCVRRRLRQKQHALFRGKYFSNSSVIPLSYLRLQFPYNFCAIVLGKTVV